MTNQSNKADDHSHLHPREQLPDVDFCIASPPPWSQAIVLGFQHYFVVLGTSVLIPTLLVSAMGGSNGDKVRVFQTLLFCAGVNTLLQTLFGTCLPTVVGGSYAFLVPILSIIYSDKLQAIETPHIRFLHTMRAIQGAQIGSSTIQIILGFSGLWGILLRYLSPLSAAPLVGLVGLGLYELGFPGVAKCVEIGIPQLIVLIVLSQYLKKKGGNLHIFERYCVLLAVPVIWAYAHLLTVSGAYKNSPTLTQSHCRTNYARLIESAPWLRIPYPLQWGSPTFDSSHVFGMMSAVIVSMVESTGGYYAVARFASATPPPPFVVSRGTGWQGVGQLLDGLLGTLTGSTVSVENAGLLGLTRVGSRRVVQVSAGFMIFFSLFGKFGAIFASIPQPIVAALFCILFSKIVACGFSFLQFVNMNDGRSKFILGFSVFMGISVPQYFNEYAAKAGYGPVRSHSHWFNDFLFVIFTSSATVAFILAMVLDNTLQRKDAYTKKNRGRHYWKKFRTWKEDRRNEEFYSLPYNLNKFFPPM
ncbi:hypothetical protein GOP47_0014504 [Adiantum capillus-veneris]|uniref:Uncharacterized protein n=1 Tax=Adiantum capillus-veneris TaxID=13818 RepID=A0A9D4ULQ7_ADICA|nr:hypothetical protein GOP47_0014504 [Adiantum capillus-veneris]